MRRASLVSFALLVLLLLYVFVPFGSQRAVLLGSDARADEVSRSDTVMILAGGGLLAAPRDTLVKIPGVGHFLTRESPSLASDPTDYLAHRRG